MKPSAEVHQTAKKSNEENWLRRAAQEADLVLEEEDDTNETGKKKALLKSIRNPLKIT